MAGPLDDLLPIRQLLLDGVKVPFAPVLEFGAEFETTFTESADGPAQNKITINVTEASVVALIPDATNASAGLATAAQITMLEDHETRVDALEAAEGVTRNGTVDLAAAAAWAAIGAAISNAASTLTQYELDIQVSWPAYTIAAEPFAAASIGATGVGMFASRNASDVTTITRRDGGTSWSFGGVVEIRAVDDGANGWKLEVRRALASAADSTTTATVEVVVRPLTADTYQAGVTPTWTDPDGDYESSAATLVDHETRIGDLESPSVTTVSANGALTYTTYLITGGTAYTLPALSAAAGKYKVIVILNLTGVDLTITSDGTDPIRRTDLTTGTTVTIPAAQRCTTLLDCSTSWEPAVGLAA
jgi:hypothetical protein